MDVCVGEPFGFLLQTCSVCNNFDIIEIYSSMLLLESRDDGTQPAKPAPSLVFFWYCHRLRLFVITKKSRN